MEALVTRALPGSVLVTGASGFLGGHVCAAFLSRGAAVRALVRQPGRAPAGTEPWVAGGLEDAAGLRRALASVTAVVHLAAHVHQPRSASDESASRAVNVEGTRLLLEAALAAGVRDFVFASTVKVMGEASNKTWTERTPPAPVDPYGTTKLEAERLVRDLAERHGLHAPILRLPLVYGPHMRANALRLFELVDRGVPLPLAAVDNRRSLLYVGNFIAGLSATLEHDAGNDLFFLSDGAPIATPDLIRAIARALGRPARLVPVPVGLMRVAARLGDRMARVVPAVPFTSATLDRVVGSLAVDSSKLSTAVGFHPPYTLDQGLAATAAWYRTRGRG
jgi:UDP-N-acetyl-alpha-D-quinovosamine dehydrogenase